MKRTTFKTTAAAALIAAPTLLIADIPVPSAGAQMENGTSAMSQPADSYHFDKWAESMEPSLAEALLGAEGKFLTSSAGETVGLIERVDANQNGNPQLVVDLVDDTALEADVLVVNVQPGNIAMKDGALMLETSVAELGLKVERNQDRGGTGRDRVIVTLF